MQTLNALLKYLSKTSQCQNLLKGLILLFYKWNRTERTIWALRFSSSLIFIFGSFRVLADSSQKWVNWQIIYRSLGRAMATMLKLKLQYFGNLMWRVDEKTWCWEWLWAGGEGDGRGWDGWMASPTLWTWVWVNSWSWWWTGRPGALRFMGSQRVGHHWATELNWTDGNDRLMKNPGSSNSRRLLQWHRDLAALLDLSEI